MESTRWPKSVKAKAGAEKLTRTNLCKLSPDEETFYTAIDGILGIPVVSTSNPWGQPRSPFRLTKLRLMLQSRHPFPGFGSTSRGNRERGIAGAPLTWFPRAGRVGPRGHAMTDGSIGRRKRKARA